MFRTARTLIFATLLAGSASADVLVVSTQPELSPDHADLQSAIDAAQDGDILLVGLVDKAPILLDGKSLVIAPYPGTPQVLVSSVTVRQLPEAATAVLIGLRNDIGGGFLGPGPGLTSILDNEGTVLLQRCRLEGETVTASFLQYQDLAVRVERSERVLFTDCELVGGYGGSSSKCTSTAGNWALEVHDSAIGLFATSATGGPAGSACCQDCPGFEDCLYQPAVEAVRGSQSTFVLNASSLVGGLGHGSAPALGGFEVQSGWLGSTAVAGADPCGGPSAPAVVGQFLRHTDVARTLEVEDVVLGGGAMTLGVSGAPSEVFGVLRAQDAIVVLDPLASFLPPALVDADVIGIGGLDVEGLGSLPTVAPVLEPGEQGRLTFVQAVHLDASGRRSFGGVRAQVVADLSP